MTESRFARLRSIRSQADEKAPAIRTLFDAAGLRPEQLRDAADLARLPVFKKEAMIEQQRLAPPYGGFLAAAPAEIERIFVSLGPTNEPPFRGEVDGRVFGAALAPAGIGRQECENGRAACGD